MVKIKVKNTATGLNRFRSKESRRKKSFTVLLDNIIFCKRPFQRRRRRQTKERQIKHISKTQRKEKIIKLHT